MKLWTTATALLVLVACATERAPAASNFDQYPWQYMSQYGGALYPSGTVHAIAERACAVAISNEVGCVVTALEPYYGNIITEPGYSLFNTFPSDWQLHYQQAETLQAFKHVVSCWLADSPTNPAGAFINKNVNLQQWLQKNYAISNSYDAMLPRWTARTCTVNGDDILGVIETVGAPTNYFDITPVYHYTLATNAYGWENLKKILKLLVWTPGQPQWIGAQGNSATSTYDCAYLTGCEEYGSFGPVSPNTPIPQPYTILTNCFVNDTLCPWDNCPNYTCADTGTEIPSGIDVATCEGDTNAPPAIWVIYTGDFTISQTAIFLADDCTDAEAVTYSVHGERYVPGISDLPQTIASNRTAHLADWQFCHDYIPDADWFYIVPECTNWIKITSCSVLTNGEAACSFPENPNAILFTPHSVDLSESLYACATQICRDVVCTASTNALTCDSYCPWIEAYTNVLTWTYDLYEWCSEETERTPATAVYEEHGNSGIYTNILAYTNPCCPGIEIVQYVDVQTNGTTACDAGDCPTDCYYESTYHYPISGNPTPGGTGCGPTEAAHMITTVHETQFTSKSHQITVGNVLSVRKWESGLNPFKWY